MLLDVAQGDIFNILLRICCCEAWWVISLWLWGLMMVLSRAPFPWWGAALTTRGNSCHYWDALSRGNGMCWRSSADRARQCLLFHPLNLRWVLHKIGWMLGIVKIWKIFSECPHADTSPTDYGARDAIWVLQVVLNATTRGRRTMSGPLFDGGIRYCVFDLFLASLERSVRMLFIAAVLFVVLNACIIIVHIFSVFPLRLRQLHLL